jgi:phosphatidylserine/phosphatidylglycerophosphate/cardiolipin synthase-like enzyme
MRSLVVILCLWALLVVGQEQPDPSYDHQNVTYDATTAPVQAVASLTVTPFFSPDHSVDTQTALVQSAQNIIRIGIPGWDSWNGCTDATNTSYGCTVQDQRTNESFPIFAAVLNAINQGITVQILTNNYSQPYYPDFIDPLGFLSIAGADVRYFTTVTFIHSKYISVDGKKAAVSSVNFSHASFMMNREAGFVIENNEDILAFLDGVFDADFAKAKPWETISYSPSDMKIIKDPSPLQVVIPPPYEFNDSYVTPLTPVTGYMNIEAITSPDMAYTTIMADLQSASDVQVYIYQITDDMCDYVSNNTNVVSTILVSNEIYSKTDYYAAKACYTRLYDQGMTIRKTAEHMYDYSHQKFWIINKKIVYLSTGNWGATDYPMGSSVFPPYNNSAEWRLTNRDFTIKITNEDIVAIFQKLIDEDYERGWDWSPSKDAEHEDEMYF